MQRVLSCSCSHEMMILFVRNLITYCYCDQVVYKKNHRYIFVSTDYQSHFLHHFPRLTITVLIQRCILTHFLLQQGCHSALVLAYLYSSKCARFFLLLSDCCAWYSSLLSQVRHAEQSCFSATSWAMPHMAKTFVHVLIIHKLWERLCAL